MGGLEVNIYLETTYQGPARRQMSGAWLVEYLLKTGQPVTRGGILFSNLATENEMTLRLMALAFSILTKSCCVRVFTRCTHVLNTMQNHWLWQWQKNGWKNAKDRPVGNVDLWKECAGLIANHITEWTDAEHSYRQCMADRTRKEMGQEHKMQDECGYLVIDVPEWNTRCRDEKRNRKKV